MRQRKVDERPNLTKSLQKEASDSTYHGVSSTRRVLSLGKKHWKTGDTE